MRVSINVTNYSWPAGITGPLSDVAAAADDAGIDTLWINDHLMQAEPGTSDDEPMLEAYTVLGFLASRTSSVRLGTMVSAATFRPAALLIKAVTTLDVLSGGRAWLGVGAGYHSGEAEAMGLPLPPTAERFDILEDTLALARQMWAGERGPFHGIRLTLGDPVGSPPPASPLRILIGGTGERRTLPLVARYGDACNLFDIPDGGATIRHKLAVLRECCAAAGRPYEAIEKTVSTRFQPGDDFARRCADFAKLGIDHVVCITAGPWTPAAVAELAKSLV
jgi:alkanesulfonate monooxygenase SsuD/methylene tetrahydromethanopterin reductase-like flavin-dependent oxidoreductase (luciferase family)